MIATIIKFKSNKIRTVRHYVNLDLRKIYDTHASENHKIV